MHELTVTARPPPRKAANSSSNAFPCGPCVRIGPSSTAATAARSRSVIHGRPNAICRISDVLDVNCASCAGGALGRDACADHAELVLRHGSALAAVDDAPHERGNQISLGGRQRLEREMFD